MFEISGEMVTWLLARLLEVTAWAESWFDVRFYEAFRAEAAGAIANGLFDQYLEMAKARQ